MNDDGWAFSIDNILHREGDKFSALIIPKYKNSFSLPRHLQRISVHANLLEKGFYKAATLGLLEEQWEFDFIGVVKQGGYYVINPEMLRTLKSFRKDKAVISIDHNTWAKSLQSRSPYDEQDILGDDVWSNEKGYNMMSNYKEDCHGKVYLYCFNCGQGDSFLLIASNGSVYLIDTNLYSDTKVDQYIRKVKEILERHNLSDKPIKGLIITHKHLDHLRGADQVLDSGKLNIETLLINLCYSHPTQCVKEFLLTAKQRIPKWVNVNRTGHIQEGETIININNPDSITANKIDTPDINDSSIVLTVCFKGKYLYLTGDVHAEVLYHKYSNFGFDSQAKSVLKVSHHGSNTGTNSDWLNLISPQYAYVSAGDSLKYNHPHITTQNLISAQQPPIDLTISKRIKRTVLYELDGYMIRKSIL